MLADDHRPFLVVRIASAIALSQDARFRCLTIYTQRMGDRIVLAAETSPGKWQTYGPGGLLAQFDGDQLGLAEWEDVPFSEDWESRT